MPSQTTLTGMPSTLAISTRAVGESAWVTTSTRPPTMPTLRRADPLAVAADVEHPGRCRSTIPRSWGVLSLCSRFSSRYIALSRLTLYRVAARQAQGLSAPVEVAPGQWQTGPWPLTRPASPCAPGPTRRTSTPSRRRSPADACASAGIDAERRRVARRRRRLGRRSTSCVVRSTWDYFDRLDEFLDWVDRVDSRSRESSIRPNVIRWNSHKGYLAELGERRQCRCCPCSPSREGARDADAGDRMADRLG